MQVQAELDRFRKCSDMSLFPYGSNIHALGWQSLNSYLPNCHDYIVTHENGTHYAVHLGRTFYMDKILYTWDNRPIGLSMDNVAWGIVLEWVDREPNIVQN